MIATVACVRAHWDTADPARPGWHAATYERRRGDLVESTDSEKVAFAVDLDGYAEDQRDEVRAALGDAFPDAEIEIV